MSDVLDANGFRVAAYLAVAAIAAVWARRERHHPDRLARDWCPPYWWLSALLLLAMAVARAGSFGELVGELGREQARSSGWYETRRAVQAVAVVTMAAVWFVGVVVAIWRVPPRRRRYLPHAVGVSGVAAFAMIRIVSLHQLDTLLYRRDLGGIRVVSVIELGLLIATALVGVTTARFPRSGAVAVAGTDVGDPVRHHPSGDAVGEGCPR